MKRLITVMIKIYQKAISPWFPASCRFSPTCSHYTLQAVQTHGVIKGLWLGLRRILKCHPYSKTDYIDPVPVLKTDKPSKDHWHDRAD